MSIKPLSSKARSTMSPEVNEHIGGLCGYFGQFIELLLPDRAGGDIMENLLDSALSRLKDLTTVCTAPGPEPKPGGSTWIIQLDLADSVRGIIMRDCEHKAVVDEVKRISIEGYARATLVGDLMVYHHYPPYQIKKITYHKK